MQSPSSEFQDQFEIDGASFNEIYERYRPLLTRHADRKGASDPEAIADLALFDGFRAFDRLNARTESAFRSYLFRAAGSHMIAEYRRSGVPVVRLDEDMPVESEVDQVLESVYLDSLVDQLPEDQREVIHCRFHLDLTAKETAERLDRTPNAVYQLQHRAVKQLRKLAFGGAVLAILAAVVWALLQMGDPDATIDRQPADEPTVVEPEQSEPVTVRAGGSIVPQPNETAVPRSSGQGPLSLVAGTDEPTSRGSANPPPAAAPAGQESDVAPIPAPATSPTPPTATPPTVTPPTLAVPPVAGPKTNAEANASRQANRAAERAASKSRKDDQKDARKAATKGSKGSSKNRNKGNGGLGGN